MKKSKTFLALILALALTTVLFASCSEPAPEESSEAPASESTEDSSEEVSAAPVALDYWQVPIYDEAEWTGLVDAYGAENNVEFTVTWVPFDGIEERVNIAVSSDTFPDVYSDGIHRLGKLIVDGVAADLTPYMPEDYNLDDVMPTVVELGMYNGEMRAAWTNYGFYPLLLNRDLFEAAGAELPDEETRMWTREEFETAVTLITEYSEETYGLSLGTGNMAQDKFIDGYIYSDGDSWINESYDELIYNSDKNIENFQWLLDLNNSAGLPGTAGNDVIAIFELFKAGQVGVMNWNDGFTPELDEAGFNYMVANYPVDEGATPAYNMTSGGLVAKSQDDKAKEEAAANFVLHVTGANSGAFGELFSTHYNVTNVRNSLRAEPANDEQAAYVNMVQASVTSVFPISNYSQVRAKWAENFQAAFVGQKDAAQALNDFVAEATPIMNGEA